MNSQTSLQDRIRREHDAHTVNDVLAESYRLKNRFAHILSYPSRQRLFAQVEVIIRGMHGKAVLDYGCGRGETSLQYLAQGAVLYGIDISPMYIAEASRKAEEAGFRPGQFQFRTMDAHALDFEDDTFDLVMGEGILHHLDADVALAEIHRVLKPGGRVLLLEPLADNPLLKIFRLLTPRARTEDEAPFTGKDIRRLVRSDRWASEIAFSGILEAPVAMITSILIPGRPDNCLLRVADRAECWMQARNLLLSWNQYVLFNLLKRNVAKDIA